jgi:hypothetical protein
MFGYQITKYDPKNRNHAGHYQKEDWIGIDDIGKTFCEKMLTLQKYLEVEDAYAQAVISIMHYLKLESLKLKNFTKLKLSHVELLDKDMLSAYENSYNNEPLGETQVSIITKLLLREEIVGILECDDMFVRFDYDYYMFVGSSKELSNTLKAEIEARGLFVERVSTSCLFDEEVEG